MIGQMLDEQRLWLSAITMEMDSEIGKLQACSENKVVPCQQATLGTEIFATWNFVPGHELKNSKSCANWHWRRTFCLMQQKNKRYSMLLVISMVLASLLSCRGDDF